MMPGKWFANVVLNGLTSLHPVAWLGIALVPGKRLLVMRTYSLWPELATKNRSQYTALLLVASVLFGIASAIPAGAVTRAAHGRHTRRSSSRAFRGLRLTKWNPVFAGSHDLLVHQNVELDRLQLP